MISDKTVQEVLEISKIEEVVGDFMQLKRRGSNLIGLCPFHQEKTPSFSVSPSKNIYKCFGCGKGGSPVQFLMDYDNLNFIEAIRLLAKKYGIEVEENILAEDRREEIQKEDSLYVLNKIAAEFYSQKLNNSDRGKSIGLSYFKTRGFNDVSITKFLLGFADSRDNEFLSYATSLGYEIDLLEEAGLVKNQKDFFKNRVIFPIHHSSGKISGFAGRILDSTLKTAKYLNSPETLIYNKSKILYGFYFAKQAIRKYDECILVEGYTDVISLHQAGFENVVAASGTALTVEQINMIKRHTQNIKFVFDGDLAGIKAAMRGIDLVLEQDLNVKILLLPNQSDPDSFIRENGKSKFEEMINEKSSDFIVFKTNLLVEEIQGDPIKKAGLVKEIVSSISLIPDPIKRNIYIKECNKILDVGEDILFNELNKHKRPRTTYQDKKHVQSNSALNDEFQERDLARILIEFGNKYFDLENTITIGSYILENIQDVIQSFDHPIYKKIVHASLERISSKNNLNPEFFIYHEDAEIRDTAVHIISTPYELSENWINKWDIFLRSQKPPEENFLKDTENMILRFRLKKINKRIAENNILIKNLFSNGDEQYWIYVKIDQELKVIRNQIAESLGQIVI